MNQFARRHVSWTSLSGAGSGEVSDCFRVARCSGKATPWGGRTPLPYHGLNYFPMPANHRDQIIGGKLATVVRALTSNFRVPDSISGSFVRSSGRLRIPQYAFIGIAIASRRAF